MGKAESREVTSPAVMSALELGSSDRWFNQREEARDEGRQREDSCKSHRQKGSSVKREWALWQTGCRLLFDLRYMTELVSGKWTLAKGVSAGGAVTSKSKCYSKSLHVSGCFHSSNHCIISFLELMHSFLSMCLENVCHLWRYTDIIFFFLILIVTPKRADQPVLSTNLTPEHKKTVPYTSPLTFQCKILLNADILHALLALSILLCCSQK